MHSSAADAARSTRLGFLIAGFATAGWAPLVPFARERARLDDAQLGLLLLFLGIGSTLAMPLAGAWVARRGCRSMLALSSLAICTALPLLASASDFASLCAALGLFGAGVGALDCTVNVQAVIVERACGRAMMSGFHGIFSLGGILGAAGVSALLSARGSLIIAVACVLASIALALALALPHALSAGEDRGPAFALPRGAVLFLGLLCFIAFLTEGAMLDWSAVFLTSVRGVEPSRAGLGYASFAFAMTGGRLTGDATVRAFGGRRVFAVGACCAALGLACLSSLPDPRAPWVGFALIGLGCSNLVPLLYSALGQQAHMPMSAAVPALTLLGYAGILSGPAAIGFIANATSLASAFLLVAACLLCVAASARLLRFS